MLSEMGKGAQWLTMMASETTGTEFSLLEQGTGIGHSTFPTAGYLGKVYESCKVTSDECCPACEIKGLTRTLHSYRISFKESIVLCENPQCIYPLGHKPLQSITIGTDLGNYQSTPNPTKRCLSKHSPRKRKFLGSASQDSLNTLPSVGPCVKHPKVITVVSPESSLVTDCGIGQNENLSEQKTLATDIVSKDPPKQISPFRDVEQSLASENTEIPYNAPQKCIQNSNSDTEQFPEELKHIKTLPVTGPAVFVPSFQGKPLHLQWRNRDALCWLDCILSSFVHLKTLKKAVAEGCTEEEDSIFKQLLSKYNQANALLTNRYRKEGDAPEVSLEVFDQAEKHLNDIRNKFFDLLQPQLKCELGKNDMPVFALPLLLQKDSSFQKLFEHSFVWKFECLQCGFRSQDRCRKTLTTFTRLVPEWHPLHAVHVAPCNNCLAQSQRREMILEQVPDVFMLHFSEGLPHSNLKAYSFQFEGGSYEISMIIQYQSNHFVTWVLTADGSWLECDDLKGPYCCYHLMCKVPPSEIHIVYWEKNLRSFSKTNEQIERENTETFPLTSAPSSSPLRCDSAGLREVPTALLKMDVSGAPSVVSSVVTSDEEKSIFGFKDLAADAMITLTLVEITIDSAGRPLENAQVIRMDEASEKDTQQLQEISSASSFQNPYQGETSPTDMGANKCPESESSIMSVEVELPAADTVGNHSTCPPTIAEVAQPSDIEKDKLINSAVITQGDFQLSLSCEGNQNVVGNEPAENPSSASNKSCKKELSSNWVDSLSDSNQKLRSRNLKDNSQQKTSATQKKHQNETSPGKVTDGLTSVKKANNFGGFIAKGLTKSIEDEVPDPVSGCTSESFPQGLPNISGLPAEHVSCTENTLTIGTMSGASNTSSQQMTSDKELPLGLNEPSKNTGILNENKQLTSNISDFVKDHKIHKLRLELRRLKAKKNELASLIFQQKLTEMECFQTNTENSP